MNEYDDRDDDRRDDPGRQDVIDRARAKATPPGVLLIVFGAITLALAGWNALTLDQLNPRLDEAVQENNAKVDADPKLTDDQKKEAKEMVASVVDVAKKVVPPVVYVNLAAGALLILGGLSLMRLSASGLVILACVVAIIPFTTFCCTGLPFGIWGLIAVNNATVRAGYRAKAMG